MIKPWPTRISFYWMSYPSLNKLLIKIYATDKP